jgi:hypothetical protein
LVLEGGVEFAAVAENEWRCLQPGHSGEIRNIDEILEAVGLRPIIITYALTPTLKIPTLATPSGFIAPSIDIAGWKLDKPSFLDMFPIEYIRGAIDYQMIALAKEYVAAADRFATGRMAPGAATSQGPWVYGGTPEPYYCFDALITTLRRTYEIVLNALWQAFGRHDKPRSFPRFLKANTAFPAELRAFMEETWNRTGA